MGKRFITDGAGQELSAQLDNVIALLKGDTVAAVSPSAYNSKDFLSEVTGREIASKLAEIATAFESYDSKHRPVSDEEKTNWNNKQDELVFDTAPAQNSTNPVTSGGLYTALAGKAASDHKHSVSSISGLPTITRIGTVLIDTGSWQAVSETYGSYKYTINNAAIKSESMVDIYWNPGSVNAMSVVKEIDVAREGSVTIYVSSKPTATVAIDAIKVVTV